jgi:hypothetical protein
LQLNKLIGVKLAAINSTRLLGSITGDVRQASRRLRELLATLLTAAAATAAAGPTAAAAGDGSGAISTEGTKSAAAAGGGGGVLTEVKLLQLLLDPLELQVSAATHSCMLTVS